MPWAAAGAGASAVGAIGNYFAQKSAADRAAALQDQNLQNWIKIHIPDPAEQKLALQQFVQQGTLDPKLEQAIKANPSQFQNIITDQKYKDAQNQALSELQDIGNSGGMRLQDKEKLQEAQQSSNDKERGDRLAIDQSMANRGMGGSGFAAAAQLGAQQSGADRNAQSSLSAAASAQDRALQSIMGAGNMATQYQNQQFNQDAQKATAADKINLFNTENAQGVQQRNIGSQNAAMSANLAAKQKVADENTQLSNFQQQYNNQLQQQQFDNETKKAAGMGGNYNALANNALQQGQMLGNTFSNIGGGLAGAATATANRNYWTDYFNKKNNNSDGGDDEEEEE
jgi:hypothetical protein